MGSEMCIRDSSEGAPSASRLGPSLCFEAEGRSTHVGPKATSTPDLRPCFSLLLSHKRLLRLHMLLLIGLAIGIGIGCGVVIVCLIGWQRCDRAINSLVNRPLA